MRCTLPHLSLAIFHSIEAEKLTPKNNTLINEIWQKVFSNKDLNTVFQDLPGLGGNFTRKTTIAEREKQDHSTYYVYLYNTV